MFLTKTGDHTYADAEGATTFTVAQPSGSSLWSVRATPLNAGGAVRISGEFTTQAEAEAALTQFALSAGFIDLT